MYHPPEGGYCGPIMDNALLALKPQTKNILLQFKQSIKHYTYFWFVYFLLSPIIQGKPNLQVGVRNGVTKMPKASCGGVPYLSLLNYILCFILMVLNVSLKYL